MSANPFPPSLQTPRRISLAAPLIFLAVMVTLGALGIRWMRSHAQSASPILHQTKTGWQHLPSPVGSPEKLRISRNGTVWVLTWGRTAMSHWDGSRWLDDKETYRATKTTFHDGNFALDGEQVWMPSEQSVVHWDGQRWNSYREVKPTEGASIVAGDGQVWIVNDGGQLFHFDKGKWTTKKLSLPGMRSGPDPEAGSPELARTSDGTVWLVSQRLWRLYGDFWLPVIADGKLLDDATMIGAAGDRLWLSDPSGIRWVSKDANGESYAAAQTGIPDELSVNDVASAGKLTWFATNSGLFEFDGSHWQQVPRLMDGTQGVHVVAAGPDGTLWTIGTIPGGILFRNARYLIYLGFLIPLGTLFSLVWLLKRGRSRQLQQHQRVTQALQHATGEVPVELEIGQKQLAGAGWVWGLQLFGSFIGYYLLRRVWPQAPVWMFPVIFVALHLAITFQQSLVKRKPQAWDPIGPGAPSKYDWAKTVKSVGGAALFLLVLNANRFPALHFLRGYTFWAGLALVIGYKSLGVSQMNKALRRCDYDGALRIIHWFHFYNPSGSEAMAMSGHILLLAGRYSEAEDALRRSFSSSSAGPTYGTALEYLGDALMEQGRYDEALRSYEAALHTFSWMRRPYRGLSELLLRQGKDPLKALESVEKIVDFAGLSRIHIKNNGRPQDDYWGLKAWALASVGRSSEVAAAIEKALEATSKRCLPDLATTHYRAGRAMQALGNVTEAKEHFRHAVEYDPNGRRGMLAKAALQESSVWRAPAPEPQPVGRA